MGWSTPTSRSTGDLITAAIWNQDVVDNPIALTPAGVTFIIDGGGATISNNLDSTGDIDSSQGSFRLPLNADLTALRLVNDDYESGTSVVSIDVNVLRTSNLSAGFPNSTGSILDSTGLTISSGRLIERTTVTGFAATDYSEGDYFTVVINSASTCKQATVDFDLVRD